MFDATGITDTAGLADMQQFFTPALRSLARSGRLVVIGALPEQADSETAAIAQRALEGFVRSAGKEVGGNGSTANLVYVGAGAEGALGSTLEFLLSPKSAFVDGQVIRLGLTELVDADPRRRSGQAAGRQGRVHHRRFTRPRRGHGRTLHRDGAEIVGLDVPSCPASWRP